MRDVNSPSDGVEIAYSGEHFRIRNRGPLELASDEMYLSSQGPASISARGNMTLSSNMGDIFFRNSQTGTTMMRLRGEDDYVGLGTIPEAKLHIHEGRQGRTSTTLKITNSEVPEGGFHRGLELTLSGKNASLSNGEEGSLSFRTNQATRLTIDSEGKVGIGTGNPSHRLHLRLENTNNIIDGLKEGLAIERRDVEKWLFRVNNMGDLVFYKGIVPIAYINKCGQLISNIHPSVCEEGAANTNSVGNFQDLQSLQQEIADLKASLQTLSAELQTLKSLTPTGK